MPRYRCSLCKSANVTKTTCPLGDDPAYKSNFKRHRKALKILEGRPLETPPVSPILKQETIFKIPKKKTRTPKTSSVSFKKPPTYAQAISNKVPEIDAYAEIDMIESPYLYEKRLYSGKWPTVNYYNFYAKMHFNEIQKMLNERKTLKGNKYYNKSCSNSKDSIKILAGHGRCVRKNESLVKSFNLPRGVRVIQTTIPGKSSWLHINLYNKIMNFYKNGYTLFKNGDNSHVLTQEGELLQYILNQKTGWESRQYRKARNNPLLFKNHYGIDHINNHVFNFYGEGCNKEGQEDWYCKVFCSENKRPNVNFLISTPPKSLETTYSEIDLRTLIQYYGQGTYIIFSCRDISGLGSKKVKVATTAISDVEKDLTKYGRVMTGYRSI